MAAVESPWLKVNSAEAGAYAREGGRALRKAITDGKLRACKIGGKGELLTRREWLDAYITERAAPVPMPLRRRA